MDKWHSSNGVNTHSEGYRQAYNTPSRKSNHPIEAAPPRKTIIFRFAFVENMLLWRSIGTIIADLLLYSTQTHLAGN
jgi:hypothetical protein